VRGPMPVDERAHLGLELEIGLAQLQIHVLSNPYDKITEWYAAARRADKATAFSAVTARNEPLRDRRSVGK